MGRPADEGSVEVAKEISEGTLSGNGDKRAGDGCKHIWLTNKKRLRQRHLG